MEIPPELRSVAYCDPGILDGTALFADTQISLYVATDSYLSGLSIDEFLSLHPGVSKEQGETVYNYIPRNCLPRIDLDRLLTWCREYKRQLEALPLVVSLRSVNHHSKWYSGLLLEVSHVDSFEVDQGRANGWKGLEVFCFNHGEIDISTFDTSPRPLMSGGQHFKVNLTSEAILRIEGAVNAVFREQFAVEANLSNPRQLADRVSVSQVYKRYFGPEWQHIGESFVRASGAWAQCVSFRSLQNRLEWSPICRLFFLRDPSREWEKYIVRDLRVCGVEATRWITTADPPDQVFDDMVQQFWPSIVQPLLPEELESLIVKALEPFLWPPRYLSCINSILRGELATAKELSGDFMKEYSEWLLGTVNFMKSQFESSLPTVGIDGANRYLNFGLSALKETSTALDNLLKFADAPTKLESYLRTIEQENIAKIQSGRF
jgi:uncharacterized protein (DUF433 family)